MRMLKYEKLSLVAYCLIVGLSGHAQIQMVINWDKVQMISVSTPTLQVVVNPLLCRGSTIHDASFGALKALGADYVRFVPWFPYPKFAVAELDTPSKNGTSWDFSLIDPLVSDFFKATEGHPVILNFSTIPAWMFRTDSAVKYPEDPKKVSWEYTQGSQLLDSTANQLARYYARLFAWYTKGGFVDELGNKHTSPVRFKVPCWEILNEPDLEHHPTPEQYSREYDAIVEAIHEISPETKFVGMALAFENDPHWFEYFLDHSHHKPDVPLDMISYHFYASNSSRQTIADMQYSYFEQADNFVNRVRYIQQIRKRLSPQTQTTVDEVGSILHDEDHIDSLYWNLSGALYAYLYLELTRLQIELIGESQLVGYPTQFPSVSMMNWKDGRPNARYWVLKLIRDNIGAGDTLVQTRWSARSGGDEDDISAQAFRTAKGMKLLVINKRDRPIDLVSPNHSVPFRVEVVDSSTGENKPLATDASGDTLHLKPFAVAVLSFRAQAPG